MILKIIDGVRAGVGNNSLDARALALNDVTEDFCRKLLTLVMANDANLNLLLVAEILVIVHLRRWPPYEWDALTVRYTWHTRRGTVF